MGKIFPGLFTAKAQNQEHLSSNEHKESAFLKTEVWLISTVVLISVIQQNDSVIHIH